MSAETEYRCKCELLGIDPLDFERQQIETVNPRLHGLDLNQNGTPSDPEHYFGWLIQQLPKVLT